MLRSKLFKQIFRLLGVSFVLISLYIFIASIIRKTSDKLQPQYFSEDEKIDWNNYSFIRYESSRVGPGENGGAHALTDPSEIEINRVGVREEGIGTIVSEQVSLNRSLPDKRLPVCLTRKYSRNLPTTSVVIVFHNEHWTLLLRCVHSIFNRSPPELLKEIILINDKSTELKMMDLTRSYIATHFNGKVKMFDNSERSGLIVSRVEGARKATGEVVVFLDSHMEVVTGWLPPLLEPILIDRRTASVPVVGNIYMNTLSYEFIGHGYLGVFDWTMTIKWIPLRENDLLKLDEAHKFPMMPGGAYAIKKDYFFELGAYDEGMRVWNGENFELTFKIWLCGGRVLQIPCSQVAHVNKARTKYKEVNYGFDYSARNIKRMAEVWMDEYKELVYKTDPKKYSLDVGDLSKQFELKRNLTQTLNCKPFKYFLDEIAPEVQERYSDERGHFASGAISSGVDPSLCITSVCLRKPLLLKKCTEQKYNQNFVLHWHRFIKQNNGQWNCFDQNGLRFYNCNFHNFGSQFWRFEPQTRRLYNPKTDQCLTALVDTLELSITKCNATDVRQDFSWTYVNETACANWETFGVKLPTPKI